jgi:hypothetical protein
MNCVVFSLFSRKKVYSIIWPWKWGGIIIWERSIDEKKIGNEKRGIRNVYESEKLNLTWEWSVCLELTKCEIEKVCKGGIIPFLNFELKLFDRNSIVTVFERIFNWLLRITLFCWFWRNILKEKKRLLMKLWWNQ